MFPYITRLNTVISPEEMTVDPIFDYDPLLKDVSNIHDLSNMTGMFDCERNPTVNLPVIGEVELPQLGEPREALPPEQSGAVPVAVGSGIAVLAIVVGVGFLITGVVIIRRSKE